MRQMSSILAAEIEGLEHLNRRGWQYVSAYTARLQEESEQLRLFVQHYVETIGSWLPAERRKAHQPMGEPSETVNASGEGGETPEPMRWLHREQKQLYRRIAKRCHPDVVRDEARRDYYASLLQQVNTAYETADSATMQRILLQLEREAMEDEEYLAYLRENQAQLRATIASLREKIDALKQSPEYRLKQKFQEAQMEGKPLLKHIVRQLMVNP